MLLFLRFSFGDRAGYGSPARRAGFRMVATGRYCATRSAARTPPGRLAPAAMEVPYEIPDEKLDKIMAGMTQWTLEVRPRSATPVPHPPPPHQWRRFTPAVSRSPHSITRHTRTPPARRSAPATAKRPRWKTTRCSCARRPRCVRVRLFACLCSAPLHLPRVASPASANSPHRCPFDFTLPAQPRRAPPPPAPAPCQTPRQGPP